MNPLVHPSPEQIRAARRLLGWNTYQLAAQSGVGQQIVATYEATGHIMAPSRLTEEPDRLAAIVEALEGAGCEFAADPTCSGVRLRTAGGKPAASSDVGDP